MVRGPGSPLGLDLRSFFLIVKLNNRSKIFLVLLKMAATVYERENCASNPGHHGECRSLTFAPPKNTEKKKPRIERTTETEKRK